MFTAMSQIVRPPKSIQAHADKVRAWVIYQLAVQGRSVASVGRDAGVSRQTIHQVFARPYPRMERLIADALGLRPEDIWPSRYDADGLPVRRMGRPKKSTDKKARQRTARNVSAQEAA